VPGRLDHAILTDLDVAAFVGGARIQDFSFTHRFSFFRPGGP